MHCQPRLRQRARLLDEAHLDALNVEGNLDETHSINDRPVRAHVTRLVVTHMNSTGTAVPRLFRFRL